MKGEYGRIGGKEEEEGNTGYGGMVQPNQQHVAPCVKMVKWGFGTRGAFVQCILRHIFYMFIDCFGKPYTYERLIQESVSLYLIYTGQNLS